MHRITALVSAVSAGYGMAGSNKRRWMHAIEFVDILVGTIYVILDLESPNLGLVRVDLLQSTK